MRDPHQVDAARTLTENCSWCHNLNAKRRPETYRELDEDGLVSAGSKTTVLRLRKKKTFVSRKIKFFPHFEFLIFL